LASPPQPPRPKEGAPGHHHADQPWQHPALNARATLVDAAGQRILPAYYSDNYVAVMPGETRTITVRWPATAGTAAAVMLEGWNVPAARAGLAQ
jgi:hypothetical protein